MTYSGTDASIPSEWLSMAGCIEYLIDDIDAYDWLLNPTPQLPTMHIRKRAPKVIAPHLNILTCKRFLGHKFRLGGSKK